MNDKIDFCGQIYLTKAYFPENFRNQRMRAKAIMRGKVPVHLKVWDKYEFVKDLVTVRTPEWKPYLLVQDATQDIHLRNFLQGISCVK